MRFSLVVVGALAGLATALPQRAIANGKSRVGRPDGQNNQNNAAQPSQPPQAVSTGTPNAQAPAAAAPNGNNGNNNGNNGTTRQCKSCVRWKLQISGNPFKFMRGTCATYIFCPACEAQSFGLRTVVHRISFGVSSRSIAALKLQWGLPRSLTCFA
jgi:hypothetical protein